MLAVIVTLFFASLLGSLHCVGMCGPFLAFAVGGGGGNGAFRGVAGPHIAYHLGRLVTYTLLGAVAGTFGAALDLSAGAFGLGNLASILASVAMIAFGAIAMMQIGGVRVGNSPLPPGARKFVMWGHRHALKMRPIHRAAVIGLLTTLLPCGWLYAFAIAAAGTANAGLGALTMAVFWLGTVPALLAFGASLQALTGALRRRLPLLTAASLIGVGLFTLAHRVQIDPATLSIASRRLDAAEQVKTSEQHVIQIPEAGTTPACCAP